MDKQSTTRIYGLIGYPVKHSFSPAMHNAAFKELNIAAEYRLFEVRPEDLEDFLLNKDFRLKDNKGNYIYAKDIEGFNITIPHKVRAKEILEKRFPLSLGKYPQQDLYYVKLSGAINTVKRGVRPLYWNTDAWGFLKSLEDKEGSWGLGFSPGGKSALVIGCGGTGRSVIASLSWKNLCRKIYIYENDPVAVNAAREHFFGQDLSNEWVDLLRQKLEFIVGENIPKTIGNCDLLVNASPVGMEEGDGSVIDKNLLHSGLSVYDVVYNQETQLIKDAKSLGVPVVGGLGMLLHQGTSAFNLWTGVPPPIDVMRQALEEELTKCQIK